MSDGDNVIPIGGITKLPIDPDQVIDRARGNLEQVVIIGYDHDGEEYFASSNPDGPDVVWMLERAKIRLLAVKPEDLYQ